MHGSKKVSVAFCLRLDLRLTGLIPTQTPEEDNSEHTQLYVWPNVWSGDFASSEKYGQTWHWMSLLRPGVIKQHAPNQTW